MQKQYRYFKLFFLFFFDLNSHFGTSNQISPCRKSNVLFINSTYIVVSVLEMQRSLTQTKAHYKFFTLS